MHSDRSLMYRDRSLVYGINVRRGAHCRDRFEGGCPLSNLAWSKAVVGGIG